MTAAVDGEQRQQQLVAAVLAADPTLTPAQVQAAVAAVAGHPAALRSLAAALSADPAAFAVGAPPTVGRLVTELRAQGATSLPEPSCVLCRRTGAPLTRSSAGGVCARCRRRQLAEQCARWEVIKPVAGRDGDRRPVCARCADRPQRICGRCGRVRRIARRAHDDPPEHRRLLHAYATWRVLRRLRRRPASSSAAPTPTGHPRTQLLVATRFLAWLDQRGLTLAHCGQRDVDAWLAEGAGGHPIRDFLDWAAQHHHCAPMLVPTVPRTTGPAIDADERWTLVARLLHDDTLDLTDRVAGALLLCYGQQLSRIAAMTTQQVRRCDDADIVSLRFGTHHLTVPQPLAGLLTGLIDVGRHHLGVGSPTTSPWLFPGHLPGRPITASRLGERLRAIGIRALPGRRASLLQLAAEVPAAVLAELLNLTPGTATRWTRDAAGDWTRYAAELARKRGYQP